MVLDGNVFYKFGKSPVAYLEVLFLRRKNYTEQAVYLVCVIGFCSSPNSELVALESS